MPTSSEIQNSHIISTLNSPSFIPSCQTIFGFLLGGETLYYSPHLFWEAYPEWSVSEGGNVVEFYKNLVETINQSPLNDLSNLFGGSRAFTVSAIVSIF